MNGLLLFICAILVLLLIGCSDGGQSQRAGTDDFSVVLSANKKCAKPGELVRLKATVTNKSSQTKLIELKDRPVFDIVIGNPDAGAKRWSDGKPLTTDLTRLELRPGDSKTIEMDWVSETNTPPIGAWFIRDARFPDNPLTPGFVIPLYCSGIGP